MSAHAAAAVLLALSAATGVRSEASGASPEVPDADVSRLEAAVAERPDDAEAHYRLALGYIRQVDETAIVRKLGLARRLHETIDRAVELDPAHRGARLAQVRFHRVAPRVVGGSRESARRLAEALRPDFPRDACLVAASLRIAEGDLDGASREIQAAGTDAGLVLARELLAEIRQQEGDLRRVGSRAASHWLLARVHAADGDAALADAEMRAARQEDADAELLASAR